MTEGVLAVMAELTVRRKALDYPMGSVLTFTSYVPDWREGSVKVMEVAVAAVGVAVVTSDVSLLVRTTIGVPWLRLTPVRVMVPVVMALVDMLVNLGETEASK